MAGDVKIQINSKAALERLIGGDSQLKIEIYKESYIGVDYAKVREEAADVANFAHMIVLKCDKLLDKS